MNSVEQDCVFLCDLTYIPSLVQQPIVKTLFIADNTCRSKLINTNSGFQLGSDEPDLAWTNYLH